MRTHDYLNYKYYSQLEYQNQITNIRSNAWPFLVTRMELTEEYTQYISAKKNDNGQIEWSTGVRVPHELALPPRYHRHNFYELVYVLSGELTHHLEQSVFHYQAGDALLLNQGIHHFEGRETMCEVMFIGLYPDYFEQVMHTNPIMPEVSQYPRSGIPYFLANSQTEHSQEYLDFSYTLEQRQRGCVSPITPLAQQLIALMEQHPPGYAYTAQGLLLQICALLEDPGYYHMQHISIDATTDELLYRRIVRFLEERNGRVSRSELGEAMHYNGDYLNRVVKRYTGKTIQDLGRWICAQSAAKLLRETELSVTEVIQRMGYSNQTSFYRLFREQMGCSPADYRQQHT